jgi:hypothetical protein
MRWIVVGCLNYGHHAVIAEDDLPRGPCVHADYYDNMPNGYEDSDDYGGPPPRWWPWLMTGFAGLALIAGYKLWEIL